MRHPNYQQRRSDLRKLKRGLIEWESRLLEALRLDLNKSTFEAFTNELGVVHNEIRHTLKHLRRWMKTDHLLPELFLLPSRAEVRPEPLGRVLIIAPWNYPVMLLLGPLAAALAAGNAVVLKPSELSVHCEAVLTAMVRSLFDATQVEVVNGGPEETGVLLKQRFDKIFFTGSPAVGKVVMRAAAEHLTPVTLELGGKSPALVDSTVDLRMTARRLVWGKFNNAGQTCVAPDYVLVQSSVRDQLLAELGRAITEFYGADPRVSGAYGRIINTRHFDRLVGYLGQGEIVHGGRTESSERYLEPTVLIPRSWDEPVMTDEIFGPILPVLTFDSPAQAVELVARRPQPLALYIFTENSTTRALWRDEIAFGGGGIHATVLQFASSKLPIGGVGNSGMGAYHGKSGFDTFSHRKSLIIQPSRVDLGLPYPPRPFPLGWIKKLMQ